MTFPCIFHCWHDAIRNSKDVIMCCYCHKIKGE